jgi:hypothetical protein
MSTNLINSDKKNPDGVILTEGIDGFRIDYTSTNLIFWSIDYQRPRNVTFTINGLALTNLDFISILVCIQNAPGSMVR